MILAALLLQAAEPQTAIEAERAFARDAQEIGQWAAFEKWAHPDGVIVGRDIHPAKQMAGALGASGEPSIPVHWWPARSFESCDGSLVVNTGPYFSPQDGSFGRFTTVWQQDGDGWRYLADMGVELDLPLAVGEQVVVERPNCDTPAASPAIVTNTDKSLLSWASRDESLRVVLSSSAENHGLNVLLWDGETSRTALNVRKDRP